MSADVNKLDPIAFVELSDLAGDGTTESPARMWAYADKWARHLDALCIEIGRKIAEAGQEMARAYVASDDPQGLAEIGQRIAELKKQRSGYEIELEQARKDLQSASEALDRLNASEPRDDLQQRVDKLLPIRHERDFFLADLADYAFKDDQVTMEAPVFSLATKPELSSWKWVSKDGKRRMEVTPSALGRATIHDKDVLIYVTSQMTEALNRKRHDTGNRVVRFTAHDYLIATNKRTSGGDYESFQAALRRLSGTRIYTNIETGDTRIKRDFGLIDSWEIVERSPVDDRMIGVEITLSEWLYNAIQAHEVLTLHPNYFRLRKPTERRLYEIARKHCGHQAQWSISLRLLYEKSGARNIYDFYEVVKDVAASDHLPDYRLEIDPDPSNGEGGKTRLASVKVTFHARRKLATFG